MSILIALILFAGSLMSWATAIAYLKDTKISRTELSAFAAQVRTAARLWWRFGWSIVDRDALSAAVRPFLRVIVLVIVAGTGFVAMFESITLRPGPFTAVNLLALAVIMAMQAPCPYLLYILRGDRRKGSKPYTGSDRRAQ